jgi:hypothetical protein
VQDALPIVIVAVVVVAGLVAIGMLVLSRGSYDHIGRSGLTFDREAPAAADDPYREEEIRQLLEATNEHRTAHGRPPLSLDAFERAPAPAKRPPEEPAARDAVVADDELRAEVRAFVESRNARRVARGQPPLDVEAEVERHLSGRDG